MLFFLVFFCLFVLPLTSIEFSTLLATNPSDPIILSGFSDSITVSSDTNINRTLHLINPDTNLIQFFVQNSQIQIFNGSDVLLQGFSFVFGSDSAKPSFFVVNNTNFFVLQNCLVKDQFISNVTQVFSVGFCQNITISALSIQNLSFYFEGVSNDLIAFFNFHQSNLILFNGVSLVSSQFKNSSFSNIVTSPLSLQNTLFLKNYFLIANGFLIIESSFSTTNLTMKGNYLDQSLLAIHSTIYANTFKLSGIRSAKNNGKYLISFNFDVTTALSISSLPVSLLQISKSTFTSEIFSSSIILLSNLPSLALNNLTFTNCASPKNLQTYNLAEITLSLFNCLNNVGSCLLLTVFSSFELDSSQIFNCSSKIYTPGLVMSNADPHTGSVRISGSRFSEIEFTSPSLSYDYLGCALFLTNVISLTVKFSYFSHNTLLLPNNFYGGPSLVFFNKLGSIFIANCSFSHIQTKQNSLSFELTAFNLTVICSGFLKNTQSDLSHSALTTAIVQGNVNYFTMDQCVLDGNFASQGLLFMSDIDFTIMNFNALHIFHNFAATTSGIYICTETTNKTIVWANSLVYDALDQTTMSVIMYLYIPNVINNFDMRVINVTMANNIGEIYTIPNIKRKTSYIVVYWGYTKNVYLEFTNSVFLENKYINPFFSCYGIEKYLQFNLTNCIFLNNVISFIWITDHLMVTVTNATFIGTLFSLGHVMYSSATESTFRDIKFINSTFQRFEIFLYTDYSNAIFENLLFSNVTCETDVFNLINMNSCILDNITIDGLQTLNLMELVNSTINSIQNLYMSNSVVGSWVIYSKSSVISVFQSLQVDNSQFAVLMSFQALSLSVNMQGIYCRYPLTSPLLNEVFLEIENSVVEINSLVWNLSYCGVASSQIIVVSSNFSLINAKIEGFKTTSQTTYFMSISKSQVFLTSATMRGFSNWISLDNSILSASNSTFLVSLPLSFSNPLFYFTNVVSLYLTAINFYRIKAITSPFLIDSSLSASSILISKCVFYACQANSSNGGAVAVSDSLITLDRNIFARNSANQGGAVYLYCSTGTYCNYSLVSNKFLRNTAQIDGGAFKWKYARPTESQNRYVQNSAAYSNDFSGFFCKIGFRLSDYPYGNATEQVIFSSFSSNSTAELIISNVTSNSPIHNLLRLYPLDSYNQIVYEQITNRIDLTVLASSDNAPDCLDASINLFGKTSQFIDSTQQAFIFDYIIVNACPNRTVTLNFSTNINDLPSNLYEKSNSRNEYSNGTYSLLIPVTIRPCVSGEIYNRLANQCEECIENYYSFSINDLECSQCPQSAYCPGRDLIVIDEDYWKMSRESATLFKCDENLNNCLGGIDSHCATDYTGRLCSNCIGDKRKNFIGECKDCPAEGANFMANCFFYFFLLILLGKVLEYISNGSSLSDQRRFLVLQLVHYVHFLFLTQKFNTNALRSSLELFITFRSSMWFSLDCFLLMLTENRDYYLNNFLKTLYVYFGFLIYLLSFIFFQRRRKEVKEKHLFFKPLFLYFFCTYPYYLCFFFQQLLCVQLEDDSYLVFNTDISCSGGYYNNWAFGFFIPNIILFILGIPIMLLFYYFGFSMKPLLKIGSFIKFVIELCKEIFKSIKFEEFLRFGQKVLLVIVRYSGLQDEDVDLVNFVVILSFFLVALKFEQYYNHMYRVLALYLLFIFLINCYFFVVLDFFYDVSLAVFFLITAIFLKLGYYIATVFYFLSKRSFGRMVSPEKIYMKNNQDGKGENKIAPKNTNPNNNTDNNGFESGRKQCF